MQVTPGCVLIPWDRTLRHLAFAGVERRPQPSFGLNKIDLVQQYLGNASGSDGNPEYRRVERAMAEKAIADAHRLGVKFSRIAMTGYAPST